MYAYATYRYFLQPYIQNPTQLTVFDINCDKGFGLSTLKQQFNFKKCVGYNSIPNMLSECKNGHSGISFYRDFIMSQQKNADILIAVDAFENYDNKSALLLRMKQALSESGILYIAQSTYNETEFYNYRKILVKTHGLKLLSNIDVTDEVINGINRMSERSSLLSADYAHYVSKIQKGLKYKIMVMKNETNIPQ